MQSSDPDPILNGVLLLGVPGGGPPLDHHDAVGPLQICNHQGTLNPQVVRRDQLFFAQLCQHFCPQRR